MRRIFIGMLMLLIAGSLFLAKAQAAEKSAHMMKQKPENYPTAIFAGGCFWCLESEFRGKDGILFTRVGYSGGALENPSYKDVSTGTTGHAEAVEITYDPAKTDYRKLVDFFLTKAHDPTQLNRQWVDEGPQYRSAIFYLDAEQKKIAEEVIADVAARKVYDKPIVTELAPSGKFWEVEDYHQQYYEKYEAENGQPHIRTILKKQKKE